MSITSGFKGKAAKKAHKLLDNKYERLEKAIMEVEFASRDKVFSELKKQYESEKVALTGNIAAGKIKEEETAPAKKKTAKKAPAKKAAKKKKPVNQEGDMDFEVE